MTISEGIKKHKEYMAEQSVKSAQLQSQHQALKASVALQHENHQNLENEIQHYANANAEKMFQILDRVTELHKNVDDIANIHSSNFVQHTNMAKSLIGAHHDLQ